ncbi:sporulation protein YhbH [Candidatus Pacearchaeota archaeon]|nr:sporulation protein YhbH [Candidatus Pacearchaeota archaeon]|tara:strand:+ start:3873 stop:5051 length:1179 start_codon:yes stop_codon:yes gene_type:complete
MSIFRNHKTSADRSATDRSRHKEKIKKAIHDGIHNIVSNESIIGQDGKKKIRIPVRGIKEYRFVYGSNEKNKKTGSAPGKNIRRGQIIGPRKSAADKKGDKAGKEAGEEFYDVEITLEELSHYLFDDLNLPDLEKKKFKKILSNKWKRKGYKDAGIRPRLSKKETLKNKIRRQKIAKSLENDDSVDDCDNTRFPFHKDDLKYKNIKQSTRENSNAVIFFIMDTSGSMTNDKKFIARSFFFLLYHFIRHKYNHTEIVFISHTIKAKEVSEDDFFKRGSSGGTFISSGLEKCLEICKKRYHKENWNIYTFHCSDGDNWPEDNDKSISLSLTLRDLCQLYCFIQVSPNSEVESMWTDGGMIKKYEPITDSKFKVSNIPDKDHVWPEFLKIFGGRI